MLTKIQEHLNSEVAGGSSHAPHLAFFPLGFIIHRVFVLTGGVNATAVRSREKLKAIEILNGRESGMLFFYGCVFSSVLFIVLRREICR